MITKIFSVGAPLKINMLFKIGKMTGSDNLSKRQLEKNLNKKSIWSKVGEKFESQSILIAYKFTTL